MLAVYDVLADSASDATRGTLATSGDAAITLLTPFISMGTTTSGNNSRCFPQITAALNIPLVNGQKQELTINSSTGSPTSGVRQACFYPTGITGASNLRFIGDAFQITGAAFPTLPVTLDGATLISNSTHTFTNELTLASTSILRCYGNNALTLTGPLKNAPGTSPTLNFADGGIHWFRNDMSAFTGTIRNAITTATQYVIIHSDATVPSTVTIDASGTSGKIRFDAQADMTIASTLTGAGTMNKTGNAALTLTGPTTSARGPFNVDAGELILAGNYTYGAITVKSGATLTVNGTLSTNATINAGATFKGRGSVGGALTIASGATVEPGVTIPALTLPGGATLRVAADDAPFSVTTLTLTATEENPLIIDLPPAGWGFIQYPLFILPASETIDESLLALPATARLKSKELEDGKTLWYLRDGKSGILINIY